MHLGVRPVTSWSFPNIVYRLMCHAKKPSSLTRRALEPSPHSERFTIACNLAGSQLGEVPGVMHLGVRPVFSLYGPMLRCRTNQ